MIGSRPGISAALEYLALALLWSALYLPNFAAPELDNEEGRRVIPAREMIVSGDLVVPTIWGRPYLAKPPGFYWAIAAVGKARGVVDEASARLPSLLATLVTAWIVYALAAAFLTRASARIAAVVYLLTPLVMEKGALGEMEALLGLAVFSATVLAWLGSRRHRAAAGASRCYAALGASRGYAALGASPFVLALALLIKGPAAWIFFVAGLAPAALAPRPYRKRVISTGLIVLVTSAALAAAWIALLAREVGWSTLSNVWINEVTGGRPEWIAYLGERARFTARSLAGLLPGSALLIALMLHRNRRRWLEPELVRIAAIAALLGFVFFLLFPRAQARYLYPLAPWLALLAGHVLARAGDAGALAPGYAILRVFVFLAAVLGTLILGCALLQFAHIVEFGTSIGALGLALAIAIGGASVCIPFFWKRSPRACLVLAFAIAAFARMIHVTEIVPHDAEDGPRREQAARIERALPAGARVYASLWSEFNTLSYLTHPVIHTEDPARLSAGDILLILDPGPLDPDPEQGENWRVLERIPLERSENLLVCLRLEPPPSR